MPRKMPFFGRDSSLSRAIVYARTAGSAAAMSSAKAITYHVPEGNADVARAAESDPRIYGAVTFNAQFRKEAGEQIRRYAEHPRFVCAKIHPAHMQLAVDHQANLDFYGLLAEKGLPLTVHTWTGDGPRAAEAAKRFPQTTFVWYHALADDYELAGRLARELPNVRLEFAVSRQIRGKVENLVTAAGAERVLFGTDESLINPIYALGPVLEADLSAEDLRRVMGANARSVFRFGPV